MIILDSLKASNLEYVVEGILFSRLLENLICGLSS